MPFRLPSPATTSCQTSGALRRLLLCCTVAVLLLPAWAPRAVAQESKDRPRTSILLPEANRLPDKNDQMQMQQEKQRALRLFKAANIERKRQMIEDTQAIIELAADVNTQLDQHASDALTPDLMSKVERIERLAHGVQQKMKFTAIK